MPMWWFMFICNMIYSVVMIAGGWMMWKHCPKKINSFIGYRTSRSMRNAETWSFANQNCGRRWWKTGWIMLIPTVLDFRISSIFMRKERYLLSSA